MDALIRPPCWPEGRPCPNRCAYALHERTVRNHTALHGPWEGWRMAGHRLIAPHGEWIEVRLLDRILWREAQLYRDLHALKAGRGRDNNRLTAKLPIAGL